MASGKNSNNQSHFSRIPRADIQRSSFDRSHGLKTTFDSGKLVPIFCDEALPGDTMSLRMSQFARLSTPLKPFMDNLYMDVFFFAVPMRLVWDNWEKFNGAQDAPGDSTDYTIPIMRSPAGGYLEGSLADYFGIPTLIPDLEHSALWHRAYQLIYEEWFRSEDIEAKYLLPMDDGPDSAANYDLQNRLKRHDYFSSCLPWAQKGDPVQLSLGDKAPVIPHSTGSREMHWTIGTETNDTVMGQDGTPANTILTLDQTTNPGSPTAVEWGVDGQTGLEADLSSAVSITVNQLREAIQIQRLYERDARGGTRYTETIRSHFGVVSPDARLQRPEYLGGGSTPVIINAIAQTSVGAMTPQANLAATGTVASNRHGFTKSFTEHCLLLGLCSVRADLSYQQGLNRMWSRKTRWDFYWPALAHLGEQSVLNKEVYAQGDQLPTPSDPEDEQVFGYQERYAEYRYKPSLITGQMRSNYAQSLDVWHLAQDFDSLPSLNWNFIAEQPPVERVLAVTNAPQFLLDAYFQYKCARPMPTYGVPGQMDHF